MSSRIAVYRKASAYSPPRPTKAEHERGLTILNLKCRVRRPELESLFIPTQAGRKPAFESLVELPASIIKSKADRILDHLDDGWTVPAESLGRGGVADVRQAESVRIWVARWLAPWVHLDSVAVVFED